jgi:hypothetical protein
MSFLSSRDRLPIRTVTSAGASRSFNFILFSPEGISDTIRAAQCLYVLTEDNPPVADVIRANFSYASCLLEIAKARGGVQEVSSKDAVAEERAVSLGILACGAFVPKRCFGAFSVF